MQATYENVNPEVVVAAIEAGVARRAVTVMEYTDPSHRIFFDVHEDDRLGEPFLTVRYVVRGELHLERPLWVQPLRVDSGLMERLLAARTAVATQPRREGYSSPYLRIGTAFELGTTVG